MDHLAKSQLNFFSQAPLERASHLRVDPNWIKLQKQAKNSKFLILAEKSILQFKDKPLFLDQASLNEIGLDNESAFFLGSESNIAYFFINSTDESNKDSSQLYNLRELADQLDMKTGSIVAYALMMGHWHRTTKYCRQCATPLSSIQGGHVLECRKCKHIEFPRINPAVIMRVCCGDKILLARQKTWPKNRYSVLAGFVEPGESLEHTVIREVKEESGVDIVKVKYHSSQPWPFPDSLMIGFSAQAQDMTLDIENDDLDKAIWVNAKQLIKKMDSREIILSPQISISHRLIEDWFYKKTKLSIKAWQNEPIAPIKIS